MSSVVLARLYHGRQGVGPVIEVIHGCFRAAVGGGWQVGKDGNRFKHYITDATVKAENAVEATFSAPSFGADYSAATHVLVGQTWDGTDAKLFINGRLQNVRTPGGVAGFTPENVTYKWGVLAFSLLDPFLGAVCAAALDESNVWTEDQMLNYWLAVKDGLDVVDGGLGWEHRWTLSGASAGAAPATISDVGTGTARDLTLVGALTVAEHRYDWFRF
jgi:hypothetical protein